MWQSCDVQCVEARDGPAKPCCMNRFELPRFSRRRLRHVGGALLLVAGIALAAWTLWKVDQRVNAAAERRAQSFTPSISVQNAPIPASKPKAALPFDEKSVMMPPEARRQFDQASEVLRRAFTSGSNSALETCVRHPAVTMPRVRALPASRGVLPVMPLEIGPRFGTTGVLLLTTLRLSDGTHRAVAMEKKNGRYLLDWESLTGWGEASFGDLLARPSSKSMLMRVLCRPSSSKAPFADEKGLSLALSHPVEKETLSAFITDSVLNATDAGKALRVARDTPYTLRVTTDAALAAQGWVRVVEIVCAGWVTDE